MFQNPLPPRQLPQYNLGAFTDSYPQHSTNAKSRNDPAHQRNLSVNSTASSHFSSPFFSSSMPIPPPPTPATSMMYGFNPGNICEDGSRSTSAYSNIPYSSLPLPVANDQLDQSLGMHAQSTQLKAMLNTINVSNTNRTLFSEMPTAGYEENNMPPPPLPQHALDAKVTITQDRRAFTWPDPRTASQQGDIGATSGERRVESNSTYSDVSMHAGCTSYPNCTSEDAEGHVVHSPPEDDQKRKDENDDSKRKQACCLDFWRVEY